jgi:hypothetical protein
MGGAMTEAAVAYVGGLLSVGLVVLVIGLTVLDRRLNRLSRLDSKLDALLRRAGLQCGGLEDVPTGVREALQQGQTIVAVKRYRQSAGAGLKEAKQFIDEVRRRGVSAG